MIMQRHRAIRNRDPEGRADRAFHQMEIAAMGADQFGCDSQPEPGAAVAGRALERLEQMLAGLGGHARTGIRDLDDGDGALPAPRSSFQNRRLHT